jgi:adenylate kinase family enzyme
MSIIKLPARVSVVGTSCSGKTTMARRLAGALGIPHVELDAIQWLPDWQPRPVDDFRARVSQAAAGESWVMDGNYHAVRDLIWARATHVVWLDLPFTVVFFRALSRTIRRVIRREELFSGNRETFRNSFLSRDSIIVWVLKTYHRRRREYPAMMASGQYPLITFIRLRSQREADRLVQDLDLRGKAG